MAGLHYFHVASRLTRAGHAPWEFLAESFLNLSKVLEVLFPPTGDGNTRDAARRELDALGYSNEEVERDFLPAMLLRNEIDVGHVDLSLYTRRQLTALHRYAEVSEVAFQNMLRRLMDRMAAGEYQLSSYTVSPSGGDAKRIIERLEGYFGSDG